MQPSGRRRPCLPLRGPAQHPAQGVKHPTPAPPPCPHPCHSTPLGEPIHRGGHQHTEGAHTVRVRVAHERHVQVYSRQCNTCCWVATSSSSWRRAHSRRQPNRNSRPEDVYCVLGFVDGAIVPASVHGSPECRPMQLSRSSRLPGRLQRRARRLGCALGPEEVVKGCGSHQAAHLGGGAPPAVCRRAVRVCGGGGRAGATVWASGDPRAADQCSRRACRAAAAHVPAMVSPSTLTSASTSALSPSCSPAACTHASEGVEPGG